MEGMDFTEFSIRYAIICAVAVAAVYMLVSLLRLSQIRRGKPSIPAIERALKFDADGIYTLRRGPLANAVEDNQPAGRRRELEAESAAAPEASQISPFGEQLFRSSVEAELQQMRDEVAALKETIAQLKAARRVSPQYNEAMSLAQVNLTNSFDKPNVNLSLTWGLRNGYMPNLDVLRGNWNAGLVLSYPVFDGFKTKNQLEQAEVNVRLAQLRYNDVKTAITMEVNQTLVDLQANEEKIGIEQLKVRLAEEALKKK